MVTCMYLESTLDLNFYPVKKSQKRTGVLHWYYNVVFPIAGSGGWIHGCAKIFWNQHDTASTVCYSKVISLLRFSHLLSVSISVCVCRNVLFLFIYHHFVLVQFLIHQHATISSFLWRAKFYICVKFKWQKWTWKRNAQSGGKPSGNYSYN